MPTVYVGIVANQLRSRLPDEGEFTVRRNAEERGRRIIYRFTSMSVCFAERNLKLRPRRRSSAAMTAISGTGSGEERISIVLLQRGGVKGYRGNQDGENIEKLYLV